MAEEGRDEKKECGRYRIEIVQEKTEQESETGVTLTKCREFCNE